MDLAKVDSLFLFLVLLAFAVGRNACGDDARSAGRLAASGVLWGAAFFTKQLGLPAAVLFMPFSLIATRGRSWMQWLSAVVAGMLAFWALEHQSNGWFSFFTMSFTKHSLNPDWWEFWRVLCRRSMWPALLLGVMFVAVVVRRASVHRESLFGHGLMVPGFAIALILTSWAVYLKKWTYLNGLMPACVGLSLMAGLAFGRSIVWWEAGTAGSPLPPAKRRSTGLVCCVVLVLLQFGLLVRHPSDALPTVADRAAATAFVERIGQLPGAVLVHNHGYYGRLAGKGAYFSSVALGDVLGADRPGSAEFDRRRQQVQEVRDSAISEQRFDWVVVDEVETSWSPWFLYVESLDFAPSAFYPVTGAKTRPERLMKKNPVAKGGAYPLTDPLWNRYLLGSWSEPQPWGRWIGGPPAKRRGGRRGRGGERGLNQPASQLARLQMALSAETEYELRIGMGLDCIAGTEIREPRVQVDVVWNGQPVTSEALSTCEEQTASFELSREAIRGGLNDLDLSVVGLAEDQRVRITRLEVAVRS
jgi:hypothetical protein